MPEPAKKDEAEIYNSFRDHMIKVHCANKFKSHDCAGKITITHKHITFQCALCGDQRMTTR